MSRRERFVSAARLLVVSLALGGLLVACGSGGSHGGSGSGSSVPHQPRSFIRIANASVSPYPIDYGVVYQVNGAQVYPYIPPGTFVTYEVDADTWTQVEFRFSTGVWGWHCPGAFVSAPEGQTVTVVVNYYYYCP